MGKTRPRRLPPNYLDGTPRHDARHPWRLGEDGLVVVDMEHRGFYDRIAQRLFKRPRVSHISLDRYGSAVWQSMDGENAVGDIVDIMKARFPGEEERMLDRVVTFLATLQRNGFITMADERAPRRR